METARCRAFLVSAETGSFTKAAEVLGYTPSGVSQLVGALEKEVGFSLLLRGSRGVRLSENGELLLPIVRHLLQQENKLTQTAAEINGLAVGTVTIGSYLSIASHWLPEIIKTFQQKYPHIQIRIIEGIRQEIVTWLNERRIDIAFMSYQAPMYYDWIPLQDDPMLAILPRSHPLAGSDVYPLKNCARESFIMPALGDDNDVTEMLRRSHITPNISFATLESFSAMCMIEQGLGMSIMNSLITKNWECDVALLPLDPPQHITLGLALHSLKDAAPAVKSFVKHASLHLTAKEQE